MNWRDDVVVTTSYDDVVTTSSRRRDDDVRRRRTYITGFSVIFLCKYLSYALLLYGERVHIRCFTYVLAYLLTLSSERRTRSYDDVVTTSWRRRTSTSWRRSRDDVVVTTWGRRTTTNITGFSVTFLCIYLYVLLTRCFHTVNEYVLAYVVVSTSNDVVRRWRHDVATTTYDDIVRI